MLTFYQTLTRYLAKTKDDSAANNTLGKERINSVNRKLCSSKNFYKNRKTRSYTSVAGANSIVLPIDFDKIISVYITNSDNRQPVRYIESDDVWDQMIEPEVSTNYPRYCHIEDNSLVFESEFTDTTCTITLRYKRKPRHMTLTDYTTGTIAVTNGDATITGTGTTFTAAMVNDDSVIIIDNIPYHLKTFTSATSLELDRDYEGVTGSGLSYTLGEMSPLHEAFHDLLWEIPAKEYYAVEMEDPKTASSIDAIAKEDEMRMNMTTNKQTTSNVIKRGEVKFRDPNKNPHSLDL